MMTDKDHQYLRQIVGTRNNLDNQLSKEHKENVHSLQLKNCKHFQHFKIFHNSSLNILEFGLPHWNHNFAIFL